MTEAASSWEAAPPPRPHASASAESAGLPLTPIEVNSSAAPQVIFAEFERAESEAHASQHTAPENEQDADNSSQANDTQVGDDEASLAVERETLAYSWIEPPSTELVPEEHTKVTANDDIRGSGGRRVAVPQNSRTDIGSFGFYQGNWSGRRRAHHLRQHIMQDLILRNPAQVLCAQEVDLEFVEALANPWEYVQYDRRPQITSAVAEAREANWGEWLVIRGTEGDESEPTGWTQSRSCIIAVRTSRARELRQLEWHKQFNGFYKTGKGNKNRAYSRILCGEITWWRPVKNTMYYRPISAHLHSKVARRDTGFGDQFASFFDLLAGVIKRTDADILTGDFNMSLFQVIPELRRRGLHTVTMVANFGFRGTKEKTGKKTSASAEAADVAWPAPPGSAPPGLDNKIVSKWDSCGIFILKPLQGPVKKRFTGKDLEDPENLAYFGNGQGYVVESYKGKQQAAKTSMDAIHVSGDARSGGAPEVRQKKINPEFWDPTRTLFHGGGHMPLLVYVGQTSFRTDKSLTQREDGMIYRGYGPYDPMRLSHMMSIGKARPTTTCGSGEQVADKGKGKSKA